MTSSSTFPQRLTKIDDLIRPDHSYLTDADSCYFLGEYTARKGYAFSPGNNLVLNFKKSVATRGTAQWQHKERAIQEIAAAFRSALPEKFLSTATLVPIPPSKAKTDPLYDDRMTRMLRAIRENPPARRARVDHAGVQHCGGSRPRRTTAARRHRATLHN